MDETPNQPEQLPAPTIRLDQYMKLTGSVRSGGEAKHRIQAGEVAVNGIVETRRSRKLRVGDQITVDGQTILVRDLAPE